MISPVYVWIILLGASSLVGLHLAMQRNGGRLPGRRSRVPGIELRQPSLRSRLALIPMFLIIVVVSVLSIPLYNRLYGTRKDNILKNLWDRSTVLLEVLSVKAGTYMVDGNVARLGLLPPRMDAIREAQYITITGLTGPSAAGTWDDIVWATNDAGIYRKIGAEIFRPGVYRIRDAISHRLERRDFDPGSWAGQMHSEPDFFSGITYDNKRFIFFRPFAHREPYGGYLHGLIRMEVYIRSLMERVAMERTSLRLGVLAVIFGAFVLGVVGVFIYSRAVITRVNRLLEHARSILNAQDERTLNRAEIRVHGQDEIAVLSNVLNSITQRLAKNSVMLSGLASGKRLQRKLLPLDTNPNGTASDFGFREVGNTVFFAYYEEAEEISGDYFDYRCLDGRYHAIMKCDVAGTGVPAALLTVQISTIFRSYLWKWETVNISSLDEMVYQINETIERVGANRRFAAFTLCIFDSKTGDMHFCNAGDNTVRIFDAAEKQLKTVTLPETPAAGILPYSMVVSKGGYRVQTINLKQGNILFMYTDGLEESRRKYRGPVFDGKTCTASVNRIPHGNYVAGQWGEELGNRRIYEVIDTVMNQGTYVLHKWHLPNGMDEYLHFDFSGCKPGVEEAIMGIVAVEKMFRCYRESVSSNDDRVFVSKKLDEFLRAHFIEYNSYCACRFECPDDSSRVCYARLKEEYRNDDLAILGIERK